MEILKQRCCRVLARTPVAQMLLRRLAVGGALILLAAVSNAAGFTVALAAGLARPPTLRAPPLPVLSEPIQESRRRLAEYYADELEDASTASPRWPACLW